MATPIQYTQQYIPTSQDIGIIQNQLDRRQSQYDAGYAAPLLFEEEFSNLPTTPESAAGREATINAFRDRVKGIVDQYGGDYGAASKDIVREIAKEKRNPFYNLAPKHAEALKRQQSLVDKYGANAIVLNEVPRNIFDEDGNLRRDINLDPRVLNQLDLERTLMTEFGKRGAIPRQSGLYKTKNTPEGFYQQSTTKGITEEEYPEVLAEMKERLYTMHPELQNDPRADNIAENMAKQLMGGTTISYKADPAFGKEPTNIFGNAVPYTDTGTGVPGDDGGKVSEKILKESSSSSKGKGEWMFGKTGDRLSPKSYLGTSSFGTANSTLENMFGSVVIRNNPDLQNLQNKPISFEELSNDTKSKLIEKGLDIDTDIKNVIKSAEDNYQVVVERLSKDKGLSKLITRDPDFKKSLFRELVDYTDGDVDAVNNILEVYDNNQSKWESSYKDDLTNLINSNAFNKSNEFGFTTLDALDKKGKSKFKSLLELGKHQLTPDRIEFLNGDYADLSKKDRVKEYEDSKSKPEIIGIGGDDQNGVIFIVKQPNGEQALAQLDVNDVFVSNVAMHMGRPDLVSAPMYKTAFEQLPKQEMAVGEDFYSKKTERGTAVLYNKENGQIKPLTNNYIQGLNKELQSKGYKGIKVSKEADPNSPFEFRSPIEYFSILKYLTNNQ